VARDKLILFVSLGKTGSVTFLAQQRRVTQKGPVLVTSSDVLENYQTLALSNKLTGYGNH
jgi:hypothetical protein